MQLACVWALIFLPKLPLCLHFKYQKRPLGIMAADQIKDLRIARWLERFVAYVVDMAIISLVGIVIAGVATDIATGGVEALFEFSENPDENSWLDYATPGILTASVFAYLALMEYYTGTTIGRKIFNLHVVDAEGNRPAFKAIAISNIGKVLLLIPDMILGLIFAKKYRQRFFAWAGGILVIKASVDNDIDPKYEFD